MGSVLSTWGAVVLVAFFLTGRDLILLGGGLFLLGKATHEIYDKLEVAHAERSRPPRPAAFGLILPQNAMCVHLFSPTTVGR